MVNPAVFLGPQSLYGNVSMASPILEKLCVPVENVRGRPRLQSAQITVQTSIGEGSLACYEPTVWDSLPSALCLLYSVTEHVRAAAEGFSFRTIMITIRRCCGISVVAPSTDVMIYLLT